MIQRMKITRTTVWSYMPSVPCVHALQSSNAAMCGKPKRKPIHSLAKVCNAYILIFMIQNSDRPMYTQLNPTMVAADRRNHRLVG